MPEAVSLLEKVVNIESASQNVAGVKSVGAVFKTEFEALGMKARLDRYAHGDGAWGASGGGDLPGPEASGYSCSDASIRCSRANAFAGKGTERSAQEALI